MLVVAQFALLGALILEVAGSHTALLARSVGAFAVVGGAAVAVAASMRLGRDLRPHPAPSASAVLRTGGPYRLVRHPIYSGLLLLAAGLALAASTAPAAVEWLALFGLLSFKARFEERLLAQRFPTYPDYARQTPRFVPRMIRPRR